MTLFNNCKTGFILAWFWSVLTDRSFQVSFNCGSCFVLGATRFSPWSTTICSLHGRSWSDWPAHCKLRPSTDDSQLHVHCQRHDTWHHDTWQPLLHVMDTALMTLATGWQQIVCKWMLLRVGCSELAPNTISHFGAGCAPALQLRWDTVTTSDNVRILGVTISSDLTLELDSHRPVQPASTGFANFVMSADHLTVTELVATLMHALTTSAIDYMSAKVSAKDDQ